MATSTSSAALTGTVSIADNDTFILASGHNSVVAGKGFIGAADPADNVTAQLQASLTTGLAAVEFVNGQNSTVAVSGTGSITSDAEGVLITGTNTGNTVLNQGAVSAKKEAVKAGSATIVNTGLLATSATVAILFEDNAVASTVTNHGTITGDVQFAGEDDTFDARAGTVNGTVKGGAGDDTYIVQNTALVIEELAAEGTDKVETSVTYKLADHIEDLELMGTDAINGFGNDEGNTLDGNTADNVMYARGGDDTVNGGEGNDTIRGGTGNDTLNGGVGDDSLAGGKGDDTINGDDGNDALLGRRGDDTMDGGAGDDKLYGARGDDDLFGGAGNDLVRGGEDDDQVYAGTGDDVIGGGKDDDELYGDAADATEAAAADRTLVQGAGNDTIRGGAGDDMISGEAGDDVIHGGHDDDIIDGGAGVDMLTGGRDEDVFVFADATHSAVVEEKMDTITDFVVGEDQMKFSDIATMTFVEEFTTTANQVRVEEMDGDTMVYVNTNTDVEAEMTIKLADVVGVTAEDMILA